MKRIQSKKYKLGTYEIGKISLSYFDDKRYVLDNETWRWACFHKDSDKKYCNKEDRDNWKRSW